MISSRVVHIVDRHASSVFVGVIVTVVVSACGSRGSSDASLDASADAPRSDAAWPCPAEWVRYERGGCGPAILLCVPGGGAASHTCDGVDLSRPHDIALPDGGAATSFYRLRDGGIGGPWPADDWTPDAGIPTCAPGWRRLADGTCDPALRTDCPAGSDPLPAGECTPTSERDCPTGEYADVSAETVGAMVVHVRSGADPMVADGSVTRPYESIARGISASGPGGWVLVAAGTYAETLAIMGAVHIVGVCSARVALSGAPVGSTEGPATVRAEGPGARVDVRGVRVGGGGMGVSATGGARVQLRAVHVDGATQVGLLATGVGTEVTADRVRVAATRALDAQGGPGVAAFAGGRVTVSRASLTGNRFVSAVAHGRGTTLAMNDSVVRGTLAGAGGLAGFGLTSDSGATLIAARVLIADNREAGAFAQAADTRLELSDSVVRGTLARADGLRGYGVLSQQGATLVAARVLIADNRSIGAFATGARTRVDLTDSVVRRTLATAGGRGGEGLTSSQGATLVAARVVLADNRETGAAALGAGTRLELTDSVVRGTLPRSDGRSGLGVQSEQGATLVAARVLLADNHAAGAVALGAGTRLELSDSVVRGTLATADGLRGFALMGDQGATLAATRVLLADSRHAGVVALGTGTRVELSDSVVRGTLATADGHSGIGMVSQQGATLLAARVLVANNREVGVWNVQGSSVRLEDVLVDGVARGDRDSYGEGVMATDGAQLDGTRVAITGTHGAALGAAPRMQGADASRASVIDLFIAGVRPAGVSFSRADSAPVAYGLYSGPGCALDATRAVIDDGGWGFFRSLGTLTLHDAVITRQDRAAGATNGTNATAPLTLDNVVRAGNANDEVLRDVDLVEIDLPPPPEACLRPPCM